MAELTTRVLEWNALLEVLATHARSPMGVARCGSLVLTADIQAARRRQQETWEMVQLQDSLDPMPALSFPDVREPLSRASKGAALDAHELRDHTVVLSLWSEIFRYMRRHGREAPALATAAATLETLPELGAIIAALEEAIHIDGSMKESASPGLLRLTHQANDLKQRTRHRLDDLLRSQSYEEILQEPYFDQREGRYVLPIKAGLQGRVSGIVHDVSSSGATVFFEPRELVELNNAIKLAELEIDREARRILRELSGLIAAQAERIGAGLEVLAELDEIAARASFSRRMGAQPVALNTDGLIRVKGAKHPLLILSRDHVIANDIVLDETVKVLIISGPNTGGKTVTLKILGLFALMVQAGLLLPCEAESDMAVFSAVYADIGDAQDLAHDLSSFSAHMTQMIGLLREAEQAGDSHSGPQASPALVLLDEPVTSTDPTEGAALAEALLCRLAALGMKVVATTHYRSLKALAQTKAGFANASVGFDLATLSPTYQLFLGMPGGSSALEIAGRLGMDQAVLDDARQKLGQEDRAFERMLSDLHGKQRQLAEDLTRISESRTQAEEAARLAKGELARLESTEREAKKSIRKKLQDQFSRARAEVQATVDEAKREQKLMTAQAAKRRLAELEAQSREALEPERVRVPIEQLKVGDLVEIGGLSTIGTLLESPLGKKRVRVRVGEGEVSALCAGLIGVVQDAGGGKDVSPVRPVPLAVTTRPRAYHASEQSVVDVRGKTADEALQEVVAVLDRAALAGAPLVRVIHGHGTGRLKAAVRDYLGRSPYVKDFRSGDRSEGGDGVTVARLRE
ncbi:MAG: Endonuclease MutS2 [Nitrospira sp.]